MLHAARLSAGLIHKEVALVVSLKHPQLRQVCLCNGYALCVVAGRPSFHRAVAVRSCVGQGDGALGCL